jgi:hypothetical protein
MVCDLPLRLAAVIFQYRDMVLLPFHSGRAEEQTAGAQFRRDIG